MSSYRKSERKLLNKGFTKRGSSSKGTDGAHKLSHRVVKGIKRHSGGRPVTKGRDGLVRKINSTANIRLKTKRGNRVLDERRDKRIVNAYAGKTHIQERTTAMRAVQAYKGAKAVGLGSVDQRLGYLTYNDGKRGRPAKIKNMARK